MENMENMDNLTEIAYVRYDGRMEVDTIKLLVSLWNSFIEETGEEDSKIFPNEAEFFEKEFDNPYDAAWAASIGDWCCTDRFVYWKDGRLSSFSFWDDENSPIDIDKIAISSLINELQGLQELQNQEDKKGYVNNISRAIQDALQEV